MLAISVLLSTCIAVSLFPQASKINFFSFTTTQIYNIFSTSVSTLSFSNKHSSSHLQCHIHTHKKLLISCLTSALTVLTLLRKLIICSVTSVLTLERSHTLVGNVGIIFNSIHELLSFFKLYKHSSNHLHSCRNVGGASITMCYLV